MKSLLFSSYLAHGHEIIKVSFNLLIVVGTLAVEAVVSRPQQSQRQLYRHPWVAATVVDRLLARLHTQ